MDFTTVSVSVPVGMEDKVIAYVNEAIAIAYRDQKRTIALATIDASIEADIAEMTARNITLPEAQ